MVTDSWKHRYILCQGLPGAGVFIRDPGLPFSDLRWRNEKTGYAQHIHMSRICIGQTYAYVTHLHM